MPTETQIRAGPEITLQPSTTWSSLSGTPAPNVPVPSTPRDTPRGAMRTSIVDSIGIEIEFNNIPKAMARTVLQRRSGWNVVEDGSCRNHKLSLGGFRLDNSDEITFVGSGRGTLFGGEFVSPVLDTNDHLWEGQVQRILDFLYEHGEGISPFTAIHVHINSSSLPLFALKYLIRLSLYLEAGFYRLACAEAGVHRGALHRDYAYCRPLTPDGPPLVHSDLGLRSIFDTRCLLKAQTYLELKQALGRHDTWSRGKYHEARYCWLGLPALFYHGTIEFRLFNSTLSAANVRAWVGLCKNMVRASFGKQVELETNYLGTSRLLLDDLAEILMLTDDQLYYSLENLWNQASYQAGIKGYQRGHTGQEVRWSGIPNKLIPPEVISDEIYDFNNFANTEQVPLVQGVTLIKKPRRRRFR